MLKSKNAYVRFLSNAILFLLFILLFDQLIGKTFSHYYYTSTSGQIYETTYSLDSTKANILVLGSSKANHHYISKMIEDSLGMSCFNAGKDGNFFFYSYAVYKSIILRYTPRIILLDIVPSEFYGKHFYDRNTTLLPYYENKPYLHRVMFLKSGIEKIKLVSSIYPFNSRLIELITSNQKREIDSVLKSKGYVPLYGNIVNLKKNKKHRNIEIEALDSNKIELLTEMTAECRKLGILLYIVKSPMLSDESQSEADKIISRIAETNHAQFLNFDKSSIFINDQTLFKDPEHLNNKGATIFTEEIINELALDK